MAGHPDFFIAPRNLNGALNGDIVLIKEISSSKDGQSTEAQVIKIVEKNNSSIVGTFFVDKKQNFVKPNNNRINGIILVGKNYMAKNGDNVVVKVDYNKKQLTGEIVEILGSSENLNALELSIIREHKLYEIFPETVIKEADKIPARVLENDIKKRKDLRNQIIFTIDGEDARDFDDAISIEKVGKIYKLGVHIADVSHYIKEGRERII